MQTSDDYTRWPQYLWDDPDWVESAWRGENSLGEPVVVVECSSYVDVTFERLSELSEIFGTRSINVGEGMRQLGYCETCAYTEHFKIITIMGITKWPS